MLENLVLLFFLIALFLAILHMIKAPFRIVMLFFTQYYMERKLLKTGWEFYGTRIFTNQKLWYKPDRPLVHYTTQDAYDKELWEEDKRKVRLL